MDARIALLWIALPLLAACADLQPEAPDTGAGAAPDDGAMVDMPTDGDATDAAPDASDHPSAPSVVVVLGDSMVESRHLQSESWVEMLDLIGAGRGGDTAQDAIERLETNVLIHDPDLVVVWLGGAHMAHEAGVEELTAGLVEIADRIDPIPVALIDLLPLCLAVYSSWAYGSDVGAYSAAVHAAAQEIGAPLLTWESWPDDACPEMYRDWIHVDDVGQPLIAEIIGAWLSDMGMIDGSLD